MTENIELNNPILDNFDERSDIPRESQDSL